MFVAKAIHRLIERRYLRGRKSAFDDREAVDVKFFDGLLVILRYARHVRLSQ